MKAKLTFQYEQDADILCISKCASYPEQETYELCDGVVARENPLTNEIESLEILFFSKILAGENLDLPIAATLQMAGK